MITPFNIRIGLKTDLYVVIQRPRNIRALYLVRIANGGILPLSGS